MANRQKTGGRTKGTPNKTTSQLRQMIADSVERYQSEGMMADLSQVTPAERLAHYRELMKLTVPKPIDEGTLPPTDRLIQFVFTDMSGENEN
jgi:hypothetical protein